MKRRTVKPKSDNFVLKTIGVVRSPIKLVQDAPLQGKEGAPEVWVDADARFVKGLQGIAIGQEIIVLTWLHLARREVLRVHPRDNRDIPLTGVFATRSSDRPNPVGLHRVRVLERSKNTLRVAPMEAIDGTPVIDMKPVLESKDS